MDAQVIKFDESTEYYFEEGCHIVELANTAADEAVSIARARVEPGQTTRWHALAETIERYVILAGEGRVEIGELPPRQVAHLDVVQIPAGVRQRITNTGKSDLVFLAICSPRFKREDYQKL